MFRTSTFFAVVLLAAVGCHSSTDTGLDEQRDALMLSQEPADAITPTDAIEAASDSVELTLAGRIHAGDIDPFQAGQAAFMLTQLPDEGHGADDPDHADNCPFCKRRLEKAPKAIVQFKDDDGKVLDVDAKELFGIKKGDAVVVRGKVAYQEATNTLTVDATGLFKRKS
ncbi:hypothetical protein [Planctomycetes bacterium K23_9]|uniref:Uncharacterized protein n=1 Tax=Stieleria marina TaxID=1930275 RepID=A0A517NSQ9_9BACT|nr:hypothetical protein K239x_21080 [Planctomycetes bacterium K23_9]